MTSTGRVCEVSARVRIGASAGFTFEYMGGYGRFAGSVPVAALIAACTSCAAESIERPSWNWSVIWLVPSALCEVMVDRPGIWPNWRSREAVMRVSMVSGAAPGNWVTIWMVGKSTSGRAETGRL